MKRSLSLLLIFMLIFSSSFSMATGLNPEKADLVLDKDLYRGNERIRVVVQLKDEPAIFHTRGSVSKYAELSENQKMSLETNVLNTQKRLQNELSNEGINFDVINSQTVGVNAFSTEIKVDDIERIENNPRVKGVFISNEYNRPEEPEMATSHDMIGSVAAWNTYGFKGENMVVAIVDTGIDPSHKDMNISDGVDVKLDKRYVNNLNLPGTFRTTKVPYGYNYFDRNKDILDVDIRSHGMHVAGTVGANGEIKGVAPEAQLLAMKVFSKDPDFPSTYDDIYMTAIDDALKLGVDVVNMSLGSTGSFYMPNSAVDEMITNAREHGVVFSISAGNSGHSTDGFSHGFPAVENPDIGLVGSPSLNKDSISVASIENTHSQVNYISYGDNQKAPYSLAGPFALGGAFDGPVEFVDVGLASPEEFEGKEVEGKVALISRGALAFTEKIENAQAAGAIVAIVYNNAGDELINMAYPDDGKIPAAFIGNTYGVELNNLEEKLMEFPAELMSSPNPNVGKMSSFTSWGTTPTLDMKPEITTPGGQIYSTLESDSYGMMSGTSMAAPHLSGGTALVLQYLKSEFPNMSPGELSEFAKTLLMNTALPVRDEYEELYSPRRQGAGLMNLGNALTSPVTVVNKVDGEAKVALKEIKGKVFDIKLLATNHSDLQVDYDVEVDVLAQWVHGQGFSFLDVESMAGARVSGDDTIRLGSGETKEISVRIDLTDALVPGIEVPIMENIFVEGFVRLVAPVENTVDNVEEELYPSLVVPYVGFYGDWFGENSPRIIDGMARFDETPYFGTTAGIVNQNTAYMGFDPFVGYADSISRLAISPGSEDEDANTEILPVMSFLRNSEEIQFNILDESGNQIRKIRTESWVRKQYSNTQGIWYSYLPARAWEGMLNNEVAPDGRYFYEIKAKPQGGDWQIYKYPVFVDTKAPEIKDFVFEDGKLTWEVLEEGVGLSHFNLIMGDEEPVIIPEDVSGKYEFEIEDLKNVKVILTAEDYAGNKSQATANIYVGEKPTMKFEEPQPFGLYDKNSINIKGNVKSDAGLESLIAYLIPDEDENAKIEVEIQVEEDGSFNKLVEDLADAVYTIRLVASDKAGQSYEIFRYFHVDTTPPVIKSIDVELVDGDGSITEKQMIGKGKSIIIPHLNEAYHRDYLEKNSKAMKNFKDAKAQGKEIYVKLADDIFVGTNGEPVTQGSIPALKYYNDKGFVENYDENGNHISLKGKVANFTIQVEENHGYFEVYVNGSQEYIQSQSGVTKRIPFDGVIEFKMNVKEDMNKFEVKIIDQAGNMIIENIIKE